MTSEMSEITIVRTIRAPAARILAAFTSAEGWVAWCCEAAECDGRVGGNFHIFTNGYNAHGVFTALEEERSSTFTWYGDGEPAMLNQVLLDELAEGTQLQFRVVVLGPVEDLLGFLAFLERTWGHAIDNLKVVLEKAG